MLNSDLHTNTHMYIDTDACIKAHTKGRQKKKKKDKRVDDN